MVLVLTFLVLIIVALAPLNVSIIIWILSYHFDLIGLLDLAGIESLVFNAVRLFAIPACVYLRLKSKGLFVFSIEREFSIITLVLFSYLFLSSLISSQFVEAFKQFIYFFNFLIGYFILRRVLTSELLKSWMFYLVVIPLVLGILQTYFLGHQYGGARTQRFTSFTSPQSFGLYMVVLYIIIYSQEVGRLKYFYIIAVLVQLLMTGSRFSLLIFVFVFLVDFLDDFKGFKLDKVSVFLGIGILAFVSYLVSSGGVSGFRSLDIFDSSSGPNSIDQIGTIKFRLVIWYLMYNDYLNSDLIFQIFGKGVSSAGSLYATQMESFGGEITDYNRIAHNEFVRVMYEFGIAGMVIFVVLLRKLMLNVLDLNLN